LAIEEKICIQEMGGKKPMVSLEKSKGEGKTKFFRPAT